ncbi:hypothetical protein AACT_1068 [Arcobacter acticola]|uniref:Uncharacterized protein n=1 Tax=Arcobacter acticola TaxID=1849015 RepID=A0A6M8EI85_9BACT|nr:hypothetical protein [Arcobacter acticola]QKE28258.1 hypothetical protein AACT_1068 [Arcobacter acticola]
MDKLQIFSAISSITLLAGIYYYNQLVEKLKSNNLKLQNDIKSLNEKIDSMFNIEKNKFLSEVRNDIKKDKDNFKQEIEESFEAFGEDIVFEFKVDETLSKSEFISLKKVVEGKKNKYEFLLSSLLNKETVDKQRLKTMDETISTIKSKYETFSEDITTKIGNITKFVNENTDRSKEGKKMAKDFEERISNLESLSFEKVTDDGSSGDYSFIGDSAEMEDLKVDYSPGNKFPPKPPKPSI